MKIIIDNKTEAELKLIDPSTGVDWVSDFIGNEDNRFYYDDETDAYHCSQEEYDWWSDVIQDHQSAYDRIAELKKEYGDEEIREIIGNADASDLELWPGNVHAALDEFEEAK